MRNLIKLLVRFHPFLLFTALEILCFVLIGRNDEYYRSNFINSANSVTGTFYANLDQVSAYFRLRKINDSLTTEIARLHNRPIQIQQVPESIDSCNEYPDTITIEKPTAYQYIAAKVIQNSISGQRNYIFLDKGRQDGIKPDMAVISQNGVVGIVTQVSERFSVVMSLLHISSHISARLLPGEFFGSLSWSRKDINTAILEEIPIHANPQKGDSVVTSGFSSIFPEGILIGHVSENDPNLASNFLEVEVDLGTEFGQLSHVWVIQYVHQDELRKLEEEVRDEQ